VVYAAKPVIKIYSLRYHEMNYSKFEIEALEFSAQDSHFRAPQVIHRRAFRFLETTFLKQLLLWRTGELARALLLIKSTQKKRGHISPRTKYKLFLPVLLVVSTLNSNIQTLNHSPMQWGPSPSLNVNFVTKRSDLFVTVWQYISIFAAKR
jgi:hypothetical protein